VQKNEDLQTFRDKFHAYCFLRFFITLGVKGGIMYTCGGDGVWELKIVEHFSLPLPPTNQNVTTPVQLRSIAT
jgi:hypothetical protein